MAKIQLTAAPTFKHAVEIPVPGESPASVEFVFKGRTKAQFKEFMDSLSDAKVREDADIVMDIACGWELDEPFDRDNVVKLVESYIGAARMIVETYIAELTAARAKN